MGKRGPKAKGAYADKSAVLSTRISAELRAHIEANKKPGDTLSHAIEHRLRRSMTEDQEIAAAFGSESNYALMRLIALVIQGLSLKYPKARQNWLDDPESFRQVRAGILGVLEVLAPKGVDDHPTIDSEIDRDGLLAALVTTAHVADLEPTIPLTPQKPHDRAAARIRVDLGDRLHRHFTPRPRGKGNANG
jgi:hypothetical protein